MKEVILDGPKTVQTIDQIISPSNFDYIEEILQENGYNIPNLCNTLYSAYMTVRPGDRMMPNKSAVFATIEAAEYLKEHGGLRYSTLDIITMILKHVMKIHCAVIYAKDVIQSDVKARFTSVTVSCPAPEWKNICTSKQKIKRTFKCIIR